MDRLITDKIIGDLEKKMVFLVGPRQVGKTWLSKQLASNFKSSIYLNYDSFEDKKIIENRTWPIDTELIIFDEIHKMPNWSTFLKGVFDTRNAGQKFLITGSAKLDLLRKTGDSLAGRYFTHHLLPFTWKEFSSANSGAKIDDLINKGGFPEPLLLESETEVKRWRSQYLDSLISFDSLGYGSSFNVQITKHLFDLLCSKVACPISYESLSRDLNVSANTIKQHINILENLYLIFKIQPFHHNISQSLLKTPKYYLFDNGLVKGDFPQKLENCVANHLYRTCVGLSDYQGENWSLAYIRTKQGKEIDFVLLKDNQPQELIEVKTSDQNFAPALVSFGNQTKAKATQVVYNATKKQQFAQNQFLTPVREYLSNLPY